MLDNVLNEFTGDMDWSDSTGYEEDLETTEWQISSLKWRVSNLENDFGWIWISIDDIWDSLTDLSNRITTLESWATWSITVKNWAWVNIVLEFTNWRLISVT